MIEVLDPGPLTTVQDQGRRGHAHLGVPPSGAVDARALALGNRIVGNCPQAAGLEMTVAGPILRFRAPTTVTVTGAPMPVTVDSRPVSMGTPIHVATGSIMHAGTITRGLRTYLSIRGGVQASLVLGSRSTDVLTGLGPAPLREGNIVLLGSETESWPNVDFVPCPEVVAEPVLEVIPGPHPEHFEPDALDALTTERYIVRPDSNRVAIKLAGPEIPRIRGDVHSEGLTTGAIQVPPSRQPILFLTDHPTTGGYPVIGVITTTSMSMAAQVRPGDPVRFTTVRPTNLSWASGSRQAQ
jgi:biotin-dependent carboxylase-like uncharacterized protein